MDKQNENLRQTDPNANRGDSNPTQNEHEPAEREKLWWSESELPDATNESRGTTGSGQRQDSN
jgi:hypothetical protein